MLKVQDHTVPALVAASLPSRRRALGGMLTLLTASAAATIPAPVAAPSSPVAAMMRRLADLWREYETVENAEEFSAEETRASAICREMWALEEAIVAARPSTMEDAATILFVAACGVASGHGFAPSPEIHCTLERAEHAVRRVAMFIGRAAGMDLRMAIGDTYLAEHLQARDPARVA